jgi:hypothetical protein
MINTASGEEKTE